MRFSCSRCLSLIACCRFLICCTVFLQGCRTFPAPTQKPPESFSRRSERATVAENSPYRSAVKAYSAGDKAGALRTLETLRRTAGLSPADQAFLDRQIALCQGKTLPSNAAVGARSPASKPLNPSTKPLNPMGDCGPRALVLAASELGVRGELTALTKAAGTTKDGTSLEGLVKAASSLGLKGEGVQVDRDALAQLPTPAVAWWEGNHFVAVLKISENAFMGEVVARVHDPNKPEPESVSLADLLAKSGGIVLTLKK